MDSAAHVAAIAGRLSLRPPQRAALTLLAELTALNPPVKTPDAADLTADLGAALARVQAAFPQVVDFERAFPSVCFSLATGVGKTRLMGAFVAYLHRVHGIRHFFVLAPNLTIYQKLMQDFTPGTPKYVLAGLAEFATTPPLLITGENYESALAVRGQDLWGRDDRVHVNIFNISKLNKDAKALKGATPRIKKLHEYIGQSYFDYLAGLDDLVLLMDESHRYRADAGVAVLNDLRPVLGLELTATPQTESAKGVRRFQNILYDYPLAAAIQDGFVKEPAVATRENFRAADYSAGQLERLKLEDGLRLHETTKAELIAYARARHERPVKPFVLVVAQSTAHAEELVALLTADDFFGGRYRGRVITVHSNQSGQEADDVVARLLAVEDPDEPTEVVVHVDKLKEGWDVRNLYTIIPLRAANARTLVEQTIGRGLRLPYGRRTGVPAVDRLTIVAHDRFAEIVDAAQDPNWIIRQTVVLGSAGAPFEPRVAHTVVPLALAALLGEAEEAAPAPDGAAVTTGPSAETRLLAELALQGIEHVQRTWGTDRLPTPAALTAPDVQAAVAAYVREALPAAYSAARPGVQATITFEAATATDARIDVVAGQLCTALSAHTISIPRILVVPEGDVQTGYRPFRFDPTGMPAFQPVAETILRQALQSGERERLSATDAAGSAEARPEDYVLRELLAHNDVAYDDTTAPILQQLCAETVAHLRTYLPDPADLDNVLRYFGRPIADFAHHQLAANFEVRATRYVATVTSGFEPLRQLSFTADAGETARDFRQPVADKLLIRQYHFGGFRRCLFGQQKFDSDTERKLAVVLEDDPDTDLRWFRPAKEQVRIYLPGGAPYQPDFVVETSTARYLLETKRRDQLLTDDVQTKRHAAEAWCEHATAHATKYGGKPWHYALLADDLVAPNYSLAGLLARALA